MVEQVVNGRGEISRKNDRSSPAHERAPDQKIDFAWGVGIEGSTIPHLGIDQFEWTQHNRFWRDDFRLVSEELGISTVRYSLPWHYIEKERGTFDWAVADERIAYASELGLDLTMDVMHFGCPEWLPQAVGDPEFPEALEHFAEALVSRYRGTIRAWCPFNEPLVTSLFSGDFGFWPPHGRKWRGYFPVLSRVSLAVNRAIRAIRRAQPDATVVLSDAADHFQSYDEELQDEIALRNARRFLLLDLLRGDVDPNHQLYEWITSYGMNPLDLEWLKKNPQMPDVIGLDYYCHSDWRLEKTPRGVRQLQAESPAGLYGVAMDYYNRFGLPMMVTETSIDGKPINRAIWLKRMVEQSRRLRQDGVPLVGLVWWPLFDHLDWDGALTHHVGKVHEVGLFKLLKQQDGAYKRVRTDLSTSFAELAAKGTEAVGALTAAELAVPAYEEQAPPLSRWSPEEYRRRMSGRKSASAENLSVSDPAAGMSETSADGQGVQTVEQGIVVFSHLRWGFVWQRPQQFLSRFAYNQPILFIEEPMFDRKEGEQPRMELHQVMTNITVGCLHAPASWAEKRNLPEVLREYALQAVDTMNRNGEFDRPLLWYYNPLDAAWSLEHFENSGIIYDCMDELSCFSGASEHLTTVEKWLLQHTDVVFTGGYNLAERKRENHDNVHVFGCGVETDHFGQAMDPDLAIPPDIDFISRPIFGWFGVVDERVDYQLLEEVARKRPDWSLVLIGPVVKVDPNTLPHAPNLFWLGGRDYSVLPSYCKAFDICMMCFAINDATEYINPTKALEYMATGRPIISTPVKDVLRQYKDVVHIASSADEFIALGEQLLEAPDRDRIQKGLKMAHANTWEANVESMRTLIRQGTANGRSAGKVQPFGELQIKYRFVSTPGS